MSIQIPRAELVDVSELKVDGQNPNRMTAQQTEALIESIKRYGFLVPIVTNQALLIADGEQRWNAAKTAGLKEVPVIRLPVEDVDRRLLRQILNKIRGEHVLNQDACEFQKIIESGRRDDLKIFLGLGSSQLNAIMRIHQARNQDINFIPDYPQETKIKEGDLFRLGDHRLMCGDSTDPQDIAKLVGDAEINSINADPPYGVYGKEWDSLRRRKSTTGATTFQDVDPKTYKEWTMSWLKNIKLTEYNTAYIWINGVNLVPLVQASYEVGFTQSSLLIWAKQTFVLASKDYYPEYETCFYGWKGKHKFYGKKKSDMFYIPRPVNSKFHPTTKPVELIQELVEDGAPLGGAVIDPFIGSGTTLIAAERAGRVCFAMDKDPKYCDVALRRWEYFTKEKAQELN